MAEEFFYGLTDILHNYIYYSLNVKRLLIFFLTLEVDINQRDQSHLKDRKQYKTRNKSTTYKYGH